MTYKIDTLLKKITLLNETIFDSMTEKDTKVIIRNFMEASTKILDADFSIAWRRFNDEAEYQLVYKSKNIPYEPPLPRKKAGNYIARKTRRPFFDNDVQPEKYEFEIRRHLKSYIIVPVFYKEKMYGNIVFCYKKRHSFTKDEVTLSNTIGNSAAHLITIHQLIKTDFLLKQEKEKTEFIANATHEIRTPLAIMRGNIDLAMEDKNIDKVKSVEKSLKAIRNEIVHLSEILSNVSILNSKTGYQKNIIHFKRLDMVILIKNLIKRLQVLLKKKNIKLTMKNIKQAPVEGDQQYLEKMFLNLIRNAIIYGKENGKIFISIKKEEDKKLIIEIKDDGTGISPEDLPHIFERFYRSERAWRTTTIGTGLGLAIVKWITEVHGGNISVSSKFGAGSIFKVSLPIRQNI